MTPQTGSQWLCGGFQGRLSDRGIAAVDEKIAAGDEARRVAGEKDRGGRDLPRLPEAPQQVLRPDRLARPLEAAIALERPLGLDRARRQGVVPDVLGRVVDRHDPG